MELAKLFKPNFSRCCWKRTCHSWWTTSLSGRWANYSTVHHADTFVCVRHTSRTCRATSQTDRQTYISKQTILPC